VSSSYEEYDDATLEGLLFDYAQVFSVIESKMHMSSIAEIEALLQLETNLH